MGAPDGGETVRFAGDFCTRRPAFWARHLPDFADLYRLLRPRIADRGLFQAALDFVLSSLASLMHVVCPPLFRSLKRSKGEDLSISGL
jgi:hypothetical protein